MTAAIPSFNAPVAPQMPNPASAPATASNPGFAQMLSQTQQDQAQEQAAPTEETTPERQPTARASERAPKADKAARGDKPAKADATRQTACAAGDEAKAEGEHTKTEATTDTAAADPALAEWLAGLQLPPAAPQAPDAARGTAVAIEPAVATDELAVTAGKAGLPVQNGVEAALGKDKRPALPDPDAAASGRPGRGKPEPSAAELAVPASNAPSTDAISEQQAAVRELAPVQDFQQHLSALAAPAVSTAGPARAAEATTAPVQVHMPVPATAPEFAQSLGVQVSVLARDGVQQAELHLNPAEMGPISIQIALDGTQAQVNFGADSAATREIIETGLPELAASLREAGFTLSGGGVHSQARGRGDGSDSGRDSHGHADGAQSEKNVTAQRTLTRVSAGGVDVYA